MSAAQTITLRIPSRWRVSSRIAQAALWHGERNRLDSRAGSFGGQLKRRVCLSLGPVGDRLSMLANRMQRGQSDALRDVLGWFLSLPVGERRSAQREFSKWKYDQWLACIMGDAAEPSRVMATERREPVRGVLEVEPMLAPVRVPPVLPRSRNGHKVPLDADAFDKLSRFEGWGVVAQPTSEYFIQGRIVTREERGRPIWTWEIAE